MFFHPPKMSKITILSHNEKLSEIKPPLRIFVPFQGFEKYMLWKCIACKWKEPKDCGTLHIYRQNTRHKELLMGRLKDDNKRFLLNLLQTLCCKKNVEKKEEKMNEDWLSIQTKNVRFYSSIFCYTFFSYLPSYYLSKTFIQSGTVATTSTVWSIRNI